MKKSDYNTVENKIATVADAQLRDILYCLLQVLREISPGGDD